MLADVLGRPLQVSAVAEASARGARCSRRSGGSTRAAPVERTVEPRPERHEIHRHARDVHRATMRWKETE